MVDFHSLIFIKNKPSIFSLKFPKAQVLNHKGDYIL